MEKYAACSAGLYVGDSVRLFIKDRFERIQRCFRCSIGSRTTTGRQSGSRNSESDGGINSKSNTIIEMNSNEILRRQIEL